MAADEFSIPAHVLKLLKGQGYSVDSAMTPHIQRWWDWYGATDPWYKVSYVDTEGRKAHRDRMTIRPARRVASEWASLLLNEDTEISVEAPRANEWLHAYMDLTNFWPNGQELVQKAFALGTAAWALWFDVRDEDTRIRVRRYDARMVVPLSWDEEGVTECAFVTRATLGGKRADQVQLHVLDGGTYHICTHVFVEGIEQSAEGAGVIADFDTLQPFPTFGIVRPAIENTRVDLSPYGVSVFDGAEDAVRAVDLAYDSIYQEIELTAPLVFIDDALIDVRTKDGKRVPVANADERRFRKVASESASDFIEIFSPNIRIDALRQGFDIALAELGELCGFGQGYFMLDKASGGYKTATEVTSGNSALMRNVRRHENALRGAIADIAMALLTCARIHCGADVEEDLGTVSVVFDDSVIVDTQTEKETMMAEIAAGLLPKWRYAVEFYGLSEEEAKAALPSVEVVDTGF